jgi:hypothetical protein
MKKINRRSWLTMLGAGAASIPLAPSILRAAPVGRRTRFIVFFSPNEPIDRAHWKPSGATDGGRLPGSLPSVMRSLEPWVDDLTFIGEMKMHTRDADDFGGGHVGIGHMLTGHVNRPWGPGNADFWAGGISVDQYIASQLEVDALTLGVQTRGSNGNTRMSYAGADLPVHPTEDPLDAFEQIFGDLDLSEAERDDRSARRRSILDGVLRNTERMRAGLGTGQARMLERHLEALRALELRLGETRGVACDPSMPSSGDLPTKARAQIDLLVEALACGVTDVATLQLGGTGGAESFNGGLSWPSVGISYPKSQHVIAHDYNESQTGDNVTRREAIEEVYYDLYAYLVSRLAEVETEPGVRLLDDTVCLYTKNIGRNHRGSELFYMIAGGAGGRLSPGRYLEREDVPHNDLLVSLCNLVGLEDVSSFGDDRFCTGPLDL